MKEDLEKHIEKFFTDRGYKIRSIGLSNDIITDGKDDVIDATRLLEIRVMKK